MRDGERLKLRVAYKGGLWDGEIFFSVGGFDFFYVCGGIVYVGDELLCVLEEVEGVE